MGGKREFAVPAGGWLLPHAHPRPRPPSIEVNSEHEQEDEEIMPIARRNLFPTMNNLVYDESN